jgi:hypothetical protein
MKKYSNTAEVQLTTTRPLTEDSDQIHDRIAAKKGY